MKDRKIKAEERWCSLIDKKEVITKKTVIIIFIFLISMNSFAEDSRIQDIRKDYTSIRKTFSSMKRYNIEVNDRSSERGQVAAYADKNGEIVFIWDKFPALIFKEAY